jgi:hypothetical protein
LIFPDKFLDPFFIDFVIFFQSNILVMI